MPIEANATAQHATGMKTRGQAINAQHTTGGHTRGQAINGARENAQVSYHLDTIEMALRL